MYYEDWNAGLSRPKHCFPAGDTEDLRAQGPAPVQAPTADFGRAAQGPWTPKSNQDSLYSIQHLSFFAKISSTGAITRLWTVSQFYFRIFQVEVINMLAASLVAQMVKNPPAVQETQVRSLSREDPLEEEMATHSSILAWRSPWTEELGGLQSMGSQRVRHDWVTNTLTFMLLFITMLT